LKSSKPSPNSGSKPPIAKGKQVPIQVGDRDFFLDLLFYHTHLHCYVVNRRYHTEYVYSRPILQ
jgi:hypothetical protein